MPDNQDKLRVLYDAVSKDYDLGAYDQFSQKMQDSNKRKAFFDGVGSEYQLGTYDEFENKIGVKKKELSTPPAKPLSSGVATLSPTPTQSQLGENKQEQQISFYNPSSFLGGGIKTDIKDKPTEPQKYVYNEKDNAERLLGFNPNSPRGGDIMNLPNATKFQTQESAAASKIAEQKFAAKEKLDKSAISNEANRRLSKTIQKKYGNNLPLKEEDYQKLEEKELAKLEQDLGNELKKGTLGIVRRTEDNEPFLAPKETFLNAMGNDIANFGENLLSSGYTLYKLTNLQTNPNGILDIANQYNLKQQSQAKIPERSQSIEGDLGTFLGQAATMIPLGMGGAATFGVHSGLTGLNNNLEKLYWEKKKGGADDYTAITESLPAALGDAGIDATVGYFLGKAMPFGTKPTVSQQLAKKTFLQSAQQSLLNANKMGMYMGGGEAAKSVIDNMAGYDRHIKDLPETFFDAASHGFATGLAFEALHTAMKVPTIVKATAKEYLSTLPQEHLFNEIDQSSLPQDAKDKIKTSMQEYNTIKESLKEFVPEKQLGTFTNYQIKANRLVDKNTELETQIKRITAAKNSGGVLEILSKNVDKKIASLNDEIKSNKLQIDNINKALEEYKTKGKEPIELDETSGEETNKIGGVAETPIKEEAQIPTEQGNESVTTPTTIDTTEEGSVAETKPIEVVQPTEEQILNDLKNKNFATFTYDSEAEVPEQLKDKISSKGEINGKKFVKVTLPQSEADYLLAKGEVPKTETPTEQPKEIISNVEDKYGLNKFKETAKNSSSFKEFEDEHTQSNLMDLSNRDNHRLGRIFSETGEGIQDVVDINNEYGKSVPTELKKGKVPKVSDGEQMVTIYRSLPKTANNIEAGDYVSFNKDYATSHNRGKTIEMKVPAKDVIWQGNDMAEWVYSPKEIRNKYKDLEDFYNKSKTETPNVEDWSKDVESVDLSKVDWKNPTTEESIAGHESHIENNVKKGQQSLLPKIRELAKKYNLTKEQYLKVLPSIRQVLSNAEPNINSIENIISRESGKNKPTERPKSETIPNVEDWSKDVESTAKALEVVHKKGDNSFINSLHIIEELPSNDISKAAARLENNIKNDIDVEHSKAALQYIKDNFNKRHAESGEFAGQTVYYRKNRSLVDKNFKVGDDVKILNPNSKKYELLDAKIIKEDNGNYTLKDSKGNILNDYQKDDFSLERDVNKDISEAYHKAKADGSNPELVKAVEDLLGKQTEQEQGNIANQPINTETNALQVRPTTQEISRPITTGENITESSGGVRPSEQGETPTQESRTETNIKGEKEIGSIFDEALEKVYNVNENGEFKKADIMAENKFKSKYGEEGKKVIDIVKNFKKYAEQLGIEIKC